MPRCQICGDTPPVGARFCIVCGAALAAMASVPARREPPRPQPIRNTARLSRSGSSPAPPLTDSLLSSASMLVLWPPRAAELPATPPIGWRRAWPWLSGVCRALQRRHAVRAAGVLGRVGRTTCRDAWPRRLGVMLISAGIAGRLAGLPGLMAVALVALLSIVLASRVSRGRKAHSNR